MPLPPRFDTARTRLARVTVSTDHPLEGALREVAAIAAEALDVGRISVWRLLDDRQAIRCQFLYQPGQLGVVEGVILQRADFPLYFRAIELRRVVQVHDVLDDPLAAEFRDRYFEPLGIGAMLDVPVYRAGVVDGIVCHEHLGGPRTWTADEAQFAAAVGETVSRLYGEALLSTARDALRLQSRDLEQLRHVAALGRLAAGIAHDFAKVLQLVQGHAELLVESTEGATRAHAADIVRAALSGRTLVEELLRLGQPHHATARVVDLSALLERATPILRMAAGPRVRLQVETPRGLPRVLIDDTQLERVLVNLVLNAREAAADGGLVVCRVKESTRLHAGQESACVTVEVADEGHGMDEPTAARIFEPYFTTKASGSGLGLAVVQQFVVMAGGSVDVESTPGAGTTIRLHLPAIAGAVRHETSSR